MTDKEATAYFVSLEEAVVELNEEKDLFLKYIQKLHSCYLFGQARDLLREFEEKIKGMEYDYLRMRQNDDSNHKNYMRIWR